MKETSYDAIVVGARCAGSPLAMLLAQKGHRVLVVDRATFPSDTLSTHVVHPLGVDALARWGLLERVLASGCPRIHTYAFDFGPVAIAGSPGTATAPFALCPRRTVLDAALVDAARQAGAEVREGFTVDEVLREDGRVVGIRGRGPDGATVTPRARVVVGADGRRSLVAAEVRPDQYHDKPAVLASQYGYWSGVPMDGRFETYIRPNRGFAAAPTNDGLTMVVAGWPAAEHERHVHDLERALLETIDLVPAFAARLRAGKRVGKLAGTSVPGFFRKPYGAGWALVGDAGYHRDPITAQGITDAFRDAEQCAAALDASFRGVRTFDDAMAEHQRRRDEHVLPIYEMTFQFATLAPPPPEMQQLLGRIHGDQRAMDGFVRMNAGTVSPREFFAAQAA